MAILRVSKHLKRIREALDKMCARCDGSGGWEPCPTCHGVGTSKGRECPTCEGIGEIHCKGCGGTGDVST